MGFSVFQIPTFDGSSDPSQWLKHCDQCFDAGQIMESMKGFAVTFRMKGAASQWYSRLEKDHGTPSWSDFVDGITKSFPTPALAPSATTVPAALVPMTGVPAATTSPPMAPAAGVTSAAMTSSSAAALFEGDDITP
jgi:hypothetical protein